MDSAPDPRSDLTAAQRIAIALGTAEDPRTAEPGAPGDVVALPGEAPEPTPA